MVWKTNASCNRDQACRLFAAGWPPVDIAREFPRTFKTVKGKLGLRYSREATKALHRRDYIAKEEGLLEQDHQVLSSAVDALLGR